MPDVTLIIPQRNFGALTQACIRGLRDHESRCWPVIVVDDGSEDASREGIRNAGFENCRVISQPPLGVTAAWNAGIGRVETPWVILLNNDVLIDGPFVEWLMQPLRAGQAFITGAETRSEPLLLNRTLLSGWCFGFAVELWRELGGFEESLRLYWSDTDFQCSAMLRSAANKTALKCVASLPLRHLGHQTARHDPRRRELWQADRARFVTKWSGLSTQRREGGEVEQKR